MPTAGIWLDLMGLTAMAKAMIFRGIQARQSPSHKVVSFAATSQEILEVARIDRAGRDKQGDLFGFQRPQISRHIVEIRDYLSRDDAVLPNAIVLAFVNGVTVKDLGDGSVDVAVDTSGGPPGLIVDGQQRLSALQPLVDRDFQVFVSAIVCRDDVELRRQFILVNNTRPLPKELIYELLPSVSGLPNSMSARSFAADLTTRLNYFSGRIEDQQEGKPAALKGEIRQHTNPRGSISSNAVQRVIMNSRANGALRDFAQFDDAAERSLQLIADYYGACADVFGEAWFGMTPRNSRLKHGAGIVAMGYVMEAAYSRFGARTREDFAQCLICLRDRAAWTNGVWNFPSESRIWDHIQNTSPDIRLLSDYLVRIVVDQPDPFHPGLSRTAA